MFFCGIDVAKRKHCALILDGQGQVVQGALSISNDRPGFERLQQVLSSLSESMLVGLEATGHYWLALYEALTALGHEVVVLNPLQVAAYRRSGMRKVKRDTTDAFWIADYIRIANLPPTSRDTPLLLQLRELTRFRSQLARSWWSRSVTASARSCASWTASFPSTRPCSPTSSSSPPGNCSRRR